MGGTFGVARMAEVARVDLRPPLSPVSADHRLLPCARVLRVARPPAAEGSRDCVREGAAADRGACCCCCCCCCCEANAEAGSGLKSGYCEGGISLPEGLDSSGFTCGGSARDSGRPATGLPRCGCRVTVSGMLLIDTSLPMLGPAAETAAASVSSCFAAGATVLFGGSEGPGGLADRISRTEAAICLLAKLTRSPKLCLDARLFRPKDASVRGSELRGKEISGCQSIGGVSLS